MGMHASMSLSICNMENVNYKPITSWMDHLDNISEIKLE